MSTYELRQRLITIARRDVGKVEDTKNQAPWIAKLWPATTYPDGMKNREPYCAAGMAYCMMRWLSDEEVLAALKMTPAQAEKWRCKSASVFKARGDNWLYWANHAKGVQVLPKKCILHAGDMVIYEYSHIELATDDDNTSTGAFIGLGYNTDASGSADGEGCWEKPRQRFRVKNFIRVMK